MTTGKQKTTAQTRAQPELAAKEPPQFLGFAPPTSNTTYTPNQFFDVCLPYCSRGTVRLVAYMIRRTLGWCDADGNPQEDQLVISYTDLVQNAAISRGAIAEAIQEAIYGNFITCLRKGRPKSARQTAVSALFELKWDNRSEYIKDPAHFQGFFEGEGHRTDIPNEFFDVCVKTESLAVIKAVGAIIRFSIGFQARRGQRRQQVALSYNDIQRYARLAGRHHLSEAIQTALDHNYIVRIQEGLFTSDIARQLSTTYAVKWLDKIPYQVIGSERLPGNQSKKVTRIGSEKLPEDRFNKVTSIEIKQTNETSKQQQSPADDEPSVVVADNAIANFLVKEGFSYRDAQALTATHPHERIIRQLEWLPRRDPSRNRLGMLRRAIEEDWSEPPAKLSGPELENSPAHLFAAHFYAGLAGHDDKPTAEPSLRDLEAAAHFTARLLAVWSAPHLVSEWGRAFGKMVAEETRARPGTVNSCVTALRSYGDRFYKQHQVCRQRTLQEAINHARVEHEKQHWGAYLAYLRTEFDRFQVGRPRDFAEFEKARTAERASVANSRFIKDESLRARQLQIFDSEKQQLKAFREFFPEVLSFWGWDEQHNPERLNADTLAL